MTLFSLLAVLSAVSVGAVATNREQAVVVDMRTVRPFPQMSGSDDDSTKMQVVVVLLVAFCVSLAITIIIRFLRKYSERQRLYSSFN